MDKTLQTHTEPLPRTQDELVELVKRALELPLVDEIKISMREGFVVRRHIAEDEAVFPSTKTQQLDPDFVLKHLELAELEFVPDEHPLQTLERATRHVTARGLLPSHFFAPEGPWVSAILDVPAEPPPTHALGMKVGTFQSEDYQEKFVVIGGPTHYLSDACYGVIVDMGV